MEPCAGRSTLQSFMAPSVHGLPTGTMKPVSDPVLFGPESLGVSVGAPGGAVSPLPHADSAPATVMEATSTRATRERRSFGINTLIYGTTAHARQVNSGTAQGPAQALLSHRARHAAPTRRPWPAIWPRRPGPYAACCSVRRAVLFSRARP